MPSQHAPVFFVHLLLPFHISTVYQANSAELVKFCIRISKAGPERLHFQQINFPSCPDLRPADLGLDTLARQAILGLSKGRPPVPQLRHP